jgi:hypothetical protein
MAFKLLNRSPWFRGTPDSIEVVDEEAVNKRIMADREKAEAEKPLGRFYRPFSTR